MPPRIFTIDRNRFRAEDLAEPAKILAEGGIVAFPTETVYGLGTNMERGASVSRLLDLTKSPTDRRLTLHLAHAYQVDKFVTDMPPAARRLMRRFWPGPLSIVLRSRDGELRGYRLPQDEIARALFDAAGVPVIAASANVLDAPPMTNPTEIAKRFPDIDAVVDAGSPKLSRVSTIVEVDERGVRVVREGAVAKDKIEEAACRRVLFVCTGNTCRSPMAESLLRRALALRLGVPEDRLAEKGWVVESAGVGATNGAAMTDEAARVLEEMGCRSREHASRRLTAAMLEDADRVFTMTRPHLSQVIEMVPDAVGKSRRLDPARDVEDPVGGGREAYRAAAKQIRKAIDQVVKQL